MVTSKARGSKIVRKPLEGWRIVVSRARKQAGALTALLEEAGAEVAEIPFIEIRPPRSFKPLNDAIRLFSEYEWLVLTSVNGVEALFERMERLGIPKSELQNMNIAAIGPATRAAIERVGLRVAVTPKEYVAEAVVDALTARVKGKRVLLCRAKVARDVIPRELRKLGAYVDVVEAYETVIPRASRVRLRAAIGNEKKRPHIITFTSSSTVHNYVNLLGIRSGESKLIRGIYNASIGPVTSETLKQYGLSLDVQAEPYTMQGMVAGIIRLAETNKLKLAQARVTASLE